jgi:hypothetical protein
MPKKAAFSECREIDFLSGKQAEFQVTGGSKPPVGQMKLFSRPKKSPLKQHISYLPGFSAALKNHRKSMVSSSFYESLNKAGVRNIVACHREARRVSWRSLMLV